MNAKFQVGDFLSPTCNPNGNVTYRVVKRTDKTITIKHMGELRRCKLDHDADGNEIFVLRCEYGGRRSAILMDKLFCARTLKGN